MSFLRSRWTLLILLPAGLVLGLLLAVMGSQAIPAGRSSAIFQDQAEAQGPMQPTRLASETARQTVPAASESAAERRQVVYTSYLHLRVDDPAGEAAAIAALLTRHSGFVEAREVREGSREGQYSAELTLRLPADRLEAVLTDLRARAIRVLREQQHASDVTDHYADLEARLRNLRHAEQELRALMTSLGESADKPETIMLAYRELTGVREQIERYEAQLQGLEQQVALATVHVRLVGPDMPAHVADTEWSAAGAFSRAGWVLVRVLQVLATVAIYTLVVGLPMALIVGMPALGAVRVVRRRLA